MSGITIKETATDEFGNIIFNKKNMITLTTAKGTNINKVYEDLSDNLNTYVKTTGGVITGNLLFQNGSIMFNDNTNQRTAFSSDSVEALNDASNSVNNIYYDAQTNTTRIEGNLEIPNKLQLSNIGDGLISQNEFSKLSGIDMNIKNEFTAQNAQLSTHTQNITDLQTLTQSHTQNISDLETLTQSHTQNISDLETLTQSHTQNISDLETLTQSHTENITDLQTLTQSHTSTLTQYLSFINDNDDRITITETDIASLQNTKANNSRIDIIDNKIFAIEYDSQTTTTTITDNLILNDIHSDSVIINNSLELDGTFTISNNDYTITNQQFSYLKDIDTNIKNKLDTIENDIITINNDINTIENDITNLNNITGTITTHTNDISNIKTDIISLNNLTGTHTTSINNHTTSINNNTTNILTLQTSNLSLQTQINEKQNIIDSLNRLDASNIADGSILNSEYQTLGGIKTTETIQHQIDTINTTILNLDGLQDLDIENIQNLQNSVSDTQTNLTNFINTQETINTNQTATNSSVSNSLISLSSTLTNHTTTINNIENDISGINTSITNIQSDITDLTTLTNTKEDIISDTHKISGAYVQTNYNGDLNVNDAFDYLHGSMLYHQELIDAKQTNINTENMLIANFVSVALQSGYTDLQTGIQEIETYINTKANTSSLNALSSDVSTINTNINSIQSDITDLTTLTNTKQDIINISNKLDSELISVNVNNSCQSTLNLVLDSLTTENETQNLALSNLQNDISINTNAISGIDTRTQTNETNIINLQAQDIIHDNAISAINSTISNIETDILNLENNKFDIPSNSNKINYSYITDGTDTLNTIISNINSNIDLKQDIINSSHKLNSSNVDFSSSNIRFADFPSSINSKFASLDGQISTLTTLQNGDVANFETIFNNFNSIDDNFDAVNLALTGKQDIISTSNYLNANLIASGEVDNTKFNYLKNLTADIQTQINGLISGSGIPSITYDAPTTTTTINDTLQITNLKFSDNSTQNIAYSTTKNNDLSDVKTKTTDITYTNNTTTIANTLIADGLQSIIISDIINDISQKQDIIDGTHKLSSDYVDFSSSNIRFADYGSSINDKFTSLDGQISTLEGVNSSQTTLNSGFASDISSLYNDKQDLLSANNKLNPAYIDASSGSLTSTKLLYLSTIDADIITKFNAKQNTISDGDLTISKTSNLQNTLDLLAPLSNPSFTGINKNEKLAEKITYSNNYTFSSNILNYSYSNNAVIFFDSLTSSTNFKMNITNMNPNNETYTSFTITLIIDVSSYKAFANTCSVNSSDYTMIASNGLSNLSVNGNSVLALQTFTIIYTNSGSIPYKVLTSISSMF